jgi:hypothetical protein
MGGYDEFEDEPVFPVRIRRPVAPGASHGADPPVTPRANGGHTPRPNPTQVGPKHHSKADWYVPAM